MCPGRSGRQGAHSTLCPDSMSSGSRIPFPGIWPSSLTLVSSASSKNPVQDPWKLRSYSCLCFPWFLWSGRLPPDCQLTFLGHGLFLVTMSTLGSFLEMSGLTCCLTFLLLFLWRQVSYWSSPVPDVIGDIGLLDIIWDPQTVLTTA